MRFKDFLLEYDDDYPDYDGDDDEGPMQPQRFNIKSPDQFWPTVSYLLELKRPTEIVYRGHTYTVKAKKYRIRNVWGSRYKTGVPSYYFDDVQSDTTDLESDLLVARFDIDDTKLLTISRYESRTDEEFILDVLDYIGVAIEYFGDDVELFVPPSVRETRESVVEHILKMYKDHRNDPQEIKAGIIGLREICGIDYPEFTAIEKSLDRNIETNRSR